MCYETTPCLEDGDRDGGSTSLVLAALRRIINNETEDEGPRMLL